MPASWDGSWQSTASQQKEQYGNSQQRKQA
jgi:hypothetical protein